MWSERLDECEDGNPARGRLMSAVEFKARGIQRRAVTPRAEAYGWLLVVVKMKMWDWGVRRNCEAHQEYIYTWVCEKQEGDGGE